MKSKTDKNLWRQDITKFEYAAGFLKTTGVFILILYVFYESALPAAVLFPIYLLYLKAWILDTSKKKETEFRNQFKDSIQAMSAAMKAGYSAENAIREAAKDIAPMYGAETRIQKEYKIMIHELDMKISVQAVLTGLAKRTEQEDVKNFANVFCAVNQRGGDSIDVIRNAVRIISGKIDTEKEIQTILAAKKMEFEIMCTVPFVIILYMKITFGDFLKILYGNPFGISVMTVCLGIYIGAYAFGRKIIRIEV